MKAELTKIQKLETLHRLSSRTFFQRMKVNKELYLLAIPGLIILILFKYLPMYGVILAFKDYNVMKGIFGSTFIGMDNFTRLFVTPDFFRAITNTLVLSVYNLVFGFPIPIILALLMNEVRQKFFKRSVQTITYIPHFFSWVVVSGIFIDLLSPSTGIVNTILNSMGIDSVYFMANTSYIRGILVFSNVWKEAGWGSILYLAAITSIDPELYQSAAIDGAGKMRQAWSITLPALKSTMVILLIMRLGHMMDSQFDQIFMMSNPAVYDVTDIIDTFVFRQSFSTLDFGFTTAAGLFKSVVNCILLVIANTTAKRLGGTGMY